MQMTQRLLKRVNIYSAVSRDSGYVGTKSVPVPLGFVYAEVFPSPDKYSRTRNGSRTDSGAVLILRREAGVKCGDLAAVRGNEPDSRVVEVKRYPGHLTVRTEIL